MGARAGHGSGLTRRPRPRGLQSPLSGHILVRATSGCSLSVSTGMVAQKEKEFKTQAQKRRKADGAVPGNVDRAARSPEQAGTGPRERAEEARAPAHTRRPPSAELCGRTHRLFLEDVFIVAVDQCAAVDRFFKPFPITPL